MRLVLLALCLSALSAGSYAALTHGLAPVRSAGNPPAPADHDRQSRATTLDASPPQPSQSPAPSRVPSVRTRVTSETYTVRGETAAEVLASMVAGSPQSDGGAFFGRTVAEIGLRYDTRAGLGGCVLVDVEVDVALTTTLPDWTPAASTELQLARDWWQFRRALAGHEGRHRQIAETGADAIARALGGLRRDACAAVEAEAQRRLVRLERDLHQAQHRYDIETGHGRTEGAVWPQ